MTNDETLMQISPAPAGLVAVYRTDEGEKFDPIVAFGLSGCRAGNGTAAMVVTLETGELSPAEDDEAFNRLEWQQSTCKCSAN